MSLIEKEKKYLELSQKHAFYGLGCRKLHRLHNNNYFFEIRPQTVIFAKNSSLVFYPWHNYGHMKKTKRIQ